MGAYTLLQDLTVSSNSTSVVLNDFGTITKDDFIKIDITFSNGTNQGTALSIIANNSVSTNYHRQLLRGEGTSVTASKANDAIVTGLNASRTASIISYLKLSENNRLNYFTFGNQENASLLNLTMVYSTSSGATFTSGITSLTFTTNVTSALGTGSRIQIYKLDAEKLADFVTTSNSTQVDIPFPTGTFSPAIDKDSEYLLVSEGIGSVESEYNLTPNDLTTLTGYHSQAIAGTGSTAVAGRINTARFMFKNANERSLSYTHIKLSNIGAYTHQAYEMRNMGISTLLVANNFVSSTAENITSITKLNIIAAATNGIGAGSRFILYKLYE